MENDFIKEINSAQHNKILIPLNLYNKHWVGFIVEKTEGRVQLNYIDTEQNMIPEILKFTLINKLSENYPKHEVIIKELDCKKQQYNNCGPELIENFIEYLTGERCVEEQTLELHSALYQAFLESEYEVSATGITL